jgi:hypothetical protein
MRINLWPTGFISPWHTMGLPIGTFERIALFWVSAISLQITGSARHEGLRACVSQVEIGQLDALEERIRLFHRHHGSGKNADKGNK